MLLQQPFALTQWAKVRRRSQRSNFRYWPIAADLDVRFNVCCWKKLPSSTALDLIVVDSN